MGDIKILVSKILIITCIYYHIYITLTHERENKRFEINSTNNVHKYFTPGTFIYTFLFDWVQEITHACLASSFLMLLSRNAVFKVITVVGIVLYNVLILSYNVIVPNYYALREWLAILGGVLALMAIEWNNQPTHNSKTSTE